jgi:hypothetical protein
MLSWPDLTSHHHRYDIVKTLPESQGGCLRVTVVFSGAGKMMEMEIGDGGDPDSGCMIITPLVRRF